METVNNLKHEEMSTAVAILEDMVTTDHSLIHQASRALSARMNNALSAPMAACLLGIGATLLPLLLVASLDLESMTQPSLGAAVPAGVKGLAILHDFNVLFMLAVSLPLILFFIVTDEKLLISAVRKIIDDEIIEIKSDVALDMAWRSRFASLNRRAQTIGVAIGLCVVYFNYLAFFQPDVGHWTMKPDGFSITGWVHLYAIFVFYWVLTVFVIRSMGIGLFLKDIVRRCNVRLVPFHPDRCGGLRPIGNLGLRNQYMLAVLGVNIVLLWFIFSHYLHLNQTINWLMMAAAIAYCILGPLVFALPLLPFRNAMQNSRDELMGIVAKRIRSELKRIRGLLESDAAVTREDEDLIERLQKVNSIVEQFPVWPFDARTRHKFFTAYLAPLFTSAIPVISSLILPYLATSFPFLNELIKFLE